MQRSGPAYSTILTLLFLSRLSDHGLRMGLVPFFPQLIERFDVTYAGVGTLFSALFITLIVMQLPVGILINRYPGGRVLAAGAGCLGLAGLLFAFAPTYVAALAARSLMGIGSALSGVACVSVAANISDKRSRGRTIAVIEIGVGTAYLLGLGIFPFLSEVVQFTTVLLIPAGLSLLLAGAFFYLGKRLEGPAPGSRDTGGTPGYPGEARPDSPSLTWADVRARAGQVLNVGVIHLILTGFLGFVSAEAMVVWLPTYLQDVHEYTQVQSSAVISFMLAIYLPSAILAGRACDEWRRRMHVLHVGCVLMSLAFAALLLGASGALLWTAAAVFGFGYAWNMGPIMTMGTEAAGEANVGIVTALILISTMAATAASGGIFGHVLDAYGSFRPVWALAGALMLIRIPLSAMTGTKQ